MSKVDLFCLGADKNMEAAISGLLMRPESMGIRQVNHQIGVHPERDLGCFHNGPEFLREFRSKAHHSLVVLDHAWDGVPTDTGSQLELMLEDRLKQASMKDWAKAVVIDPELEAWVFAQSPHVSDSLGWEGSTATLRAALEVQELWAVGDAKPRDPKAAVEWALYQARLPRSSSIYRKLARRVSTTSCTDRAFSRFRRLLQGWFPAAVTDS